MSTLNLTLVQANLTWHQPEQNRLHLQQLLRTGCGATDMVVLPEMFTTGFTMQAEDFAESMRGPTVQWMSKLALELDAAVCGSLIVKDNGDFRNRFVFALPGGQLLHYDKRHLFAMAGEDRSYAAGRRRAVVEFRGWRICPMICYDLRFPAWSRNTEEFDLLVYVANWPDRRREHWRVLCRARAIENQCYVAAVNRVGTDGKGHAYSGDSTLVDYAGEERWQCAGKEAVRTLSLDREAMTAYRERFPFLADRDNIELQC
jgi:predicted amidohydrolase